MSILTTHGGRRAAAPRFVAVLLLCLLLPSLALAQVIETYAEGISARALAIGNSEVDSSEQLYVGGDGHITRIDADGTRTVIAGTGTVGFSGDGGSATAAKIGRVGAISVGSESERAVWFVDIDANRIRKIKDGIITTVAGNGSTTFSGEGGQATSAGFAPPVSMVVAWESGTIFFSSGHRVLMVTKEGTISTFANSSGVAGNTPAGSSIADTRLDSPAGLTYKFFDLYIVDAGNRRVLRVPASPGSTANLFIDGSAMSDGELDAPSIAFLSWNSTRLYLANPQRHRLLRHGDQMADAPYAGTGVAGFSGDGGWPDEAQLSGPTSVAAGSGQVFIADQGNNRVRRIYRPDGTPTAGSAPVAVAAIRSGIVTVAPWSHPAHWRPMAYSIMATPIPFGGAATEFTEAEGWTHRVSANDGVESTFRVAAVYDNPYNDMPIYGPQSPPSNAIVAMNAQQPTAANASVVEGDSGTTQMVFTISVQEPVIEDLVFDVYTTRDSIAQEEDFDDVAVEGMRILKGTTSTTLSVPVHGDTLPEDNEDFGLTIVWGGTWTWARGTILDDDGEAQSYFGVPDRGFAVENGGESEIDVLANDDVAAGALATGHLEITQAPAHGSVRLETAGTTTAADDRFRYTPAANWSGRDAFAYRFCDSADACFAATVDVDVSLVYDPPIGINSNASRVLVSGVGARALPELRFAATPLLLTTVDTLRVAGDPTRSTPWDLDGAGTAIRVYSLPAAIAGAPVSYQVYATSSVTATNDDSYLYLGVDSNGDGRASADEVRCVSAFAGRGQQECDFALEHPGTGTVRWWALVHNHETPSYDVDLHAAAVPMTETDGSLVATGPASVPAANAFSFWVGWRKPTLAHNEIAAGYVRVFSGATEVDRIPAIVQMWDIGGSTGALALANGIPEVLRVTGTRSADRLFIDVPAGASSLTVTTDSDANFDLYLAPAPAPDDPSSSAIASAPWRDSAPYSAISAGGDEQIVVSGAALTPGRWYVTPHNVSDVTAAVAVTATIATAATPVVRPGSYFNANRSGHGIFLYPAGDQWAALWYTYAAGRRATWYYAQAPKPGADGIWRAPLFHSVWTGSGNRLTRIGSITVTPTGPDQFQFTHDVTGVTASEPMAALGRGCPTLGGLPVDMSSHWFNPATSGTGFSVQMWADYEYYSAFVYDAFGEARFLTAESNSFAGADATLRLDQLNGFSPSSPWPGNPTRFAVGTLRRVVSNGTLARIELAATYVDGVPGTWNSIDPVQTLGGPGTTQGCTP